MKTVKYEFRRAGGFDQVVNGNRASTDAIGIVVNWANPDKSRSYTKHIDKDELLVASLTFNDSDVDAETDLASRCNQAHISYIRSEP